MRILKPTEVAESDDIEPPSTDESPQNEDDSFARIDFGNLFGEGEVGVQTSILLQGDYTSPVGKHLDHAVWVGIRSVNQVDGSQPNKCIAHNCEDERVARRFRGTIVLSGMSSLIKERRPVDLAAVDFSLVTILLHEHHQQQMYSFEPKETPGAVILSPRVAAAHDASPFNDVYVKLPPDHIIWTAGDRSELSRFIGMPLLTLEWKVDEEDEDDDKWETSLAAFLHVNFRTNANAAEDPAFGAIPQEWFEATGSILVVREDGQPISAGMVEALCKFSAQESRRLLMHATEEANNRRDAIAQISKKNWEEFLVDYEQ